MPVQLKIKIMQLLLMVAISYDIILVLLKLFTKMEGLMAKSGFKVAVSLVKTVNREIKKAEREAAKNQRQIEMQARKEAREQERYARKSALERKRQAKQENKLAAANEKEQIKAEISEAKEAYEYRCEERKFLREQIINEELK